jgi:hypothetical protein
VTGITSRGSGEFLGNFMLFAVVVDDIPLGMVQFRGRDDRLETECPTT